MCSGWERELHILLNYHRTHFWFLLLVILVILVCLNWFRFRFFKLEYTWFNVVLVSAVHQRESVIHIHVVVVQLLSRIQLCDPMDCSTPGFPVLHYLPEFAQTHVHWVIDAIQPSHPLLLPSPPALNLFQHEGLFQRVSSSHQVASVGASASALVLPMNISFKIDWFDLLAVQGVLLFSRLFSHIGHYRVWRKGPSAMCVQVC